MSQLLVSEGQYCKQSPSSHDNICLHVCVYFWDICKSSCFLEKYDKTTSDNSILVPWKLDEPMSQSIVKTSKSQPFPLKIRGNFKSRQLSNQEDTRELGATYMHRITCKTLYRLELYLLYKHAARNYCTFVKINVFAMTSTSCASKMSAQ